MAEQVSERKEGADLPAKISVIAPIYNGERFLDRFFEAALSQTCRNLEIFCVDDGSTDATPQIMKKYAERDERIRLLRQENSGAGAARNAGLALATGDYFAFWDIDDVFEPEMLEKLLASIQAAEADICVCRSDAFSVNTGRTRPNRQSFRDDYLPAASVFSRKDAPDHIFNMFVGWPWDKLFRGDFIRGLGLKFQELSNSNDVYFVYSALVRAERITTCDEILVHKGVGIGDSVSNAKTKRWDNAWLAYRKIREDLIQDGLFEEVRRSYLNRVLRNTIWNMRILGPEGFEQLYNFLRDEGFAQLGFTGELPADYFYDPEIYEEAIRILRNPLVTYMKEEGDRRIAALKETTTFRVGSFITRVPRRLARKLKRLR